MLSVSDSSAPTLDMECQVDEMDGEQTWPNEDDMAQAEQARRLPAGELCVFVCLDVYMIFTHSDTFFNWHMITVVLLTVHSINC